MDMKYWLLLSVFSLLCVTFSFYLLYDTGHGNIFSQQTIQDNCLKVLNQFVNNHPDNLHCDILNKNYGNDLGVSYLYVYTAQDGSKLTIDPELKKISLVDKNGNNLPLPIK